MKKAFTIFITASCLIETVFAQNSRSNYAAISAERDAEKFVLNEIDLKKFKADRSLRRTLPAPPNLGSLLRPGLSFNNDVKRQRDTIDYYADWFKPSKATTPDTLLLKDSIYTQHFRAIAYHKTASRAKGVTSLGVVGIVAGGIVVVVGIAALFLAAFNGVKI